MKIPNESTKLVYIIWLPIFELDWYYILLVLFIAVIAAMYVNIFFLSFFPGVPISTQWGPQGHHYPIQIAQFGLSHYSKFLTEEDPDVTILEDGDDEDLRDWGLPSARTHIKVVSDPEVGRVVEFEAPGENHFLIFLLKLNLKKKKKNNNMDIIEGYFCLLGVFLLLK